MRLNFLNVKMRVGLNEQTLLQLKSNDPNLNTLSVSFSRSNNTFDAGSVDWEKEGDCIGENTHLTALRIEGRGRNLFAPGLLEEEHARENAKAFYRSVSCNRSIKHLVLDKSPIDIGDMFTILSPFFQHNRNLRKLEVMNSALDRRGLIALVAALSSCNKNSLREIEFICCRGMDDESAKKLIDAVAKYSNLRHLYFHFGIDNSKKLCIALGNLFQNPSSRLAGINLCHNKIDDEGAIALANGLANNDILKWLGLYGNEITAIGCRALSRALTKRNIHLEMLHVGHNNIDDEGLNALGSVIVNNPKLTDLDLSSNYEITTVGWRTLFNQLQNSNSSLETLNLWFSDIQDEVVATMVGALASIASLKSLDLTDERCITTQGWVSIPSLLQQPNCSLEKLCLSDNGDNINDEVAIAFAYALVNNKSLNTLQLGDNCSDNDAMTTLGWSALSNVLCNKSSIESIYNSNHTVEKVIWKDVEKYLPSDLVSHLRLNRNEDKAEVARQKILRYHFANGVSNVEDFVGMQIKVLPRAISWIGRDVDGLSLLYNLLQSMPTLLDFDSKANAIRGKRKRGGDFTNQHT